MPVVFFIKRIVPVCIFLMTFSCSIKLYCINPFDSLTFYQNDKEQDTLKNKQNLYNGKVWTNRYRKVNSDQFLFSNYFMPGTVSVMGRTYRNLHIKYDIYSDEILIPFNDDEILQLNKEMVDSFSINFENKVYKFIKIKTGTLNNYPDYNGYLNVLYNKKSVLYVKYKKEISSGNEDLNEVEFTPNQKIYFYKNNIVYQIITKKDLFNALDANPGQIKEFIKANKLKVSKKIAESYIQVIRFSDNMNQ